MAKYLSAGRQLAVGTGCSPCRICGTPNGFEEFTDGIYLWPEGFAHYVLDHGVRPPHAVVEHALNSANAVDAVGLVDRAWWTTAMS